MALVNYGDSDPSSDDDLCEEALPTRSSVERSKPPGFHDKVEDEYKMRIPKNAKPLLEPLNIRRKSGINGKVILTIPTIEDFVSSDESDSDESIPTKEHPKPVGSKSTKSLLDLLPPTRAFIVREGDKPVIPSPLIPRQAVRAVPSKPANPPVSDNNLMVEDELDEDKSSPEGFFTFTTTQECSTASTTAEEVRRRTRESILAAEAAAASKTSPDLELGQSSQELPVLSEKPFKDWELPKRPRLERTDGGTSGEEEEEEEMEPIFTAETFIPGPERKRARLGRGGVGASSVAELLSASGPMKVREVRAEDLTAGANLELLKGVTTGPPKMVPQQHVVDNPGKLAFRKHQITWLAYKAQEQEYELQERWAEARRNQIQSRQKYGF